MFILQFVMFCQATYHHHFQWVRDEISRLKKTDGPNEFKGASSRVTPWFAPQIWNDLGRTGVGSAGGIYNPRPCLFSNALVFLSPWRRYLESHLSATRQHRMRQRANIQISPARLLHSSRLKPTVLPTREG